MHQWKTWAAAAVLLFLGAGRAPQLTETTKQTIPRAEQDAWRVALRLSYQAGQRKDYRAALDALESARKFAAVYPGDKLAALTWMYEGNALAAQLRFAGAMNAYGEARTAAVRAGDREMTAVASHNLSSIYTALISQEDAQQWTESMRRDLAALRQSEGEPWMRIPMLLQQARAASRKQDFESARRYFGEAFLNTALTDQPQYEATALEWLGVERYLAKDYRGAEDALSNAFRIRRLSKDGSLVSVARALSNVFLDTGRTREALTMAELALRSAARGQSGYLHFWSCLRTRARALWELGKKDEAIADLKRAAQSPHLRELPADSLRIATVAGWHRLFEMLVDLTARRYSETGDRRYLLDSLAAADADRAFALRQASAKPALPESHWPLLTQYQDVYRRLYVSDSPEAREQLREIRQRLTAAETQASPIAVPAPEVGAEKLGALGVDRDQAVIVFYAAPDRLYRWSRASGEPWRLDALPAPQPLFDSARDYSAGLARGEWNATLGAGLYRGLFGTLPSAAGSAGEWLVVPDDELFRLPFSTLAADGASGRFLLDDHAVRVLPGLWALDSSRGGESPRTLFAGVGDAVYNIGDPRVADRVAGFKSSHGDNPMLELARLPGTGRELLAASKAWPGQTLLLTGIDASSSKLEAALAGQPAVVHLATHVLPAPDDERESLLALSLDGSGAPEFIGPAWISARRVPGSLVVMSGCRSASGKIRPGEGLLGLTRAWLYAGARNVVATHWPLLDDSGEFWEQFYRSLGETGSPTRALRFAQRWLRAQAQWRERPTQWGAYFVVSQGG